MGWIWKRFIDSVACFSLSGYVSNDNDCNDSLATVNPNVAANTIDDNCNNIVDEGCGNGAFHIKLMIEGLYQGGGFMISPLFDNGMNPDPNSSDSVYVELRAATSPYSLVHSHQVVLYRNGFASILP